MSSSAATVIMMPGRLSISLFLVFAVVACPAFCSAAAVPACCPCDSTPPEDHHEDDCDERPCFCSLPAPDIAQSRDSLPVPAPTLESATAAAQDVFVLDRSDRLSHLLGWPPTGTNAGLLSIPLLN